MVNLKKNPDTIEKLHILSRDSQYDLACACGTKDDEHRKRSQDDKWIYPVSFEDGRRTFLFKTLLSNVCANDCKYCPLRANQDPRRTSIKPEELAKIFLEYYRADQVSGLFLSSGIIGTPDNTMEKINNTAAILRRSGFRGYMHLKVIPGASDAAIEEAVSLSSAVSINIETAGEKHFKDLSKKKDYLNDIIRPLKLISQLTSKGSRYSRVKQTTQFIVGASSETDGEIINYSGGLYKRLGLSRVYFSAYQKGLGDAALPGENHSGDILTREHRLYQADWLMRKYGFKAKEIPIEADGNLSLAMDPKEAWARNNPDFFPVDINRADQHTLLRVPGLGPTTVKAIMKLRSSGSPIKSLDQLGKIGKRLLKTAEYIILS